MTAHPVRPQRRWGRARRLAAATLLAGAVASVTVTTPAGAAPDRAIGPISVPPIVLAPVLTVPGLGVRLPLVVSVGVSPLALRLGLTETAAIEAPAPPSAASAVERAPTATPVAAIEPGLAVPISTDAAPPRPNARAQLPSPGAETAIVRVERSSTALFVLLAVALGFLIFLVVRGRADGTGLLAARPLDGREEVLEFP